MTREQLFDEIFSSIAPRVPNHIRDRVADLVDTNSILYESLETWWQQDLEPEYRLVFFLIEQLVAHQGLPDRELDDFLAKHVQIGG